MAWFKKIEKDGDRIYDLNAPNGGSMSLEAAKKFVETAKLMGDNSDAEAMQQAIDAEPEPVERADKPPKRGL